MAARNSIRDIRYVLTAARMKRTLIRNEIRTTKIAFKRSPFSLIDLQPNQRSTSANLYGNKSTRYDVQLYNTCKVYYYSVILAI